LTEFISVGGVRMRVSRDAAAETADDRPPLLLVNGIGGTIEMCTPLREELSGRRVIAFDMPGSGMSPPLRAPMRMRGLAALIAELVVRLGHERVDVLGYSFGGVVAQELARRHPERIRRLALCATLPGWPSVPSDPIALWLMLTPARYYDARLAKVMVPRIAGGRTARDAEALQRDLERRRAHPPSLRGYLHQIYALTGWTSHPWLPRLGMPTLIVQGDADPLVATINARWLARRIPHAELHIVPGGGHLMLFDEPERVAPAIDAFLSR
jgi:pimeloyl-ACP methyl ester carboxylesterase